MLAARQRADAKRLAMAGGDVQTAHIDTLETSNDHSLPSRILVLPITVAHVLSRVDPATNIFSDKTDVRKPAAVDSVLCRNSSEADCATVTLILWAGEANISFYLLAESVPGKPVWVDRKTGAMTEDKVVGVDSDYTRLRYLTVGLEKSWWVLDSKNFTCGDCEEREHRARIRVSSSHV